MALGDLGDLGEGLVIGDEGFLRVDGEEVGTAVLLVAIL